MTPPNPQRSDSADIRPLVARKPDQMSIWFFFGVAVAGGVLLFTVLDGRRQAASAPAIRPPVPSSMSFPPLPPLIYPPDPPPPPALPEAPEPVLAPTPAPSSSPSQQEPPAAPVYPPAPPPPVYAPPPEPPVYAPRPSPALSTDASNSVLVIDTSSAARRHVVVGTVDTVSEAVSLSGDEPVRAGVLARHSMTVPRGTLIPAVLETALDSTRPGFVRAIISRDIRGFDGARVLVPRGSRLFGEYQADLSAGQNRATIQWTRLVRPDGVTIALDSPAADREGRTGVPGRVDSHFLERFGNALIQTTLNIGANLAGRSLSDGSVIVALPGSAQVTGSAVDSEARFRPTLRVAAGTRVTAIVARDLDFSSGQSS